MQAYETGGWPLSSPLTLSLLLIPPSPVYSPSMTQVRLDTMVTVVDAGAFLAAYTTGDRMMQRPDLGVKGEIINIHFAGLCPWQVLSGKVLVRKFRAAATALTKSVARCEPDKRVLPTTPMWGLPPAGPLLCGCIVADTPRWVGTSGQRGTVSGGPLVTLNLCVIRRYCLRKGGLVSTVFLLYSCYNTWYLVLVCSYASFKVVSTD